MRWSLCIALAAAALTAWPAAPRAADAELRTGRPAALTQEVIGVELTPASMALDSSVSRFQAGYGGSLRLFRHRWDHVYVIPIEAGLYVGEYFGHNVTIAAHLMAEGGVIVPGTGGAWSSGWVRASARLTWTLHSGAAMRAVSAPSTAATGGWCPSPRGI